MTEDPWSVVIRQERGTVLYPYSVILEKRGRIFSVDLKIARSLRQARRIGRRMLKHARQGWYDHEISEVLR